MIQRHNELRDLEAELLNVVCNDVQIEHVNGRRMQEVNGQIQDQTNQLTFDLMYTHEAFGRDKDLHSFMSRYVT